jgi:hypothetical protein
MVSPQSIINWFRQFTIWGNEKELKFMRKKALTGYTCHRYENCLFLHFLAAMSSTGGNLHVWEEINKDISIMPVSIDINEFLHLSYLAEYWTKEYEYMNKI